MEETAAQGDPWIFAALLIWASIVWFVTKRDGHGHDGIVDMLMGLDLRQIMTLRAAAISVVGFLILGVALWAIPN